MQVAKHLLVVLLEQWLTEAIRTTLAPQPSQSPATTPNGWHVSAIGDGLYTGHRSYMYSTDGASYIPSNDAGSTMSGSGSNWAFKFASGTNSPAISTGYTNFKAIPDAYTKIISSNSDNPTTEQTFSVTYGVSIGDSQAAGTYTGEVKYILVAPEIEIDPDQVGILDWAGRSAGYTQVEYIESNGSQYILTDYVVDYTDLTLEYKYYKVDSLQTNPLGVDKSSSPREMHGNAWGGNLYYGNSSVAYSIGEQLNTVYTMKFEISNTLGYGKWTRNGVEYSVPAKGLNGWSGATIVDSLFGTNAGAKVNYVMKGRLYYARYYRNNAVLERDFIPVVKDGVYGMWDNVTNTFYGNAGTGSFTGGPEV